MDNEEHCPLRYPVDLVAENQPSGSPFRLAGRVEQVHSEFELSVADALAQVTIRLQSPFNLPISEGDLVVLAVTSGSNGLRATRVEQHESARLPSGGSEWARFRWQGQAQRLVMRAKLTKSTRQWFDSRGFLEVHTPTLLKTPGLDSGVDPLSAEGGYLVTSPELHMKRMLVGGLPRLYQLATCFRREELGPRHQPEFTMLEWYRSFSDLSQILADTEQLIWSLAAPYCTDDCLTVCGMKVHMRPPFATIAVADAFRIHASIDNVYELAASDPDRYFELLVGKVEPALALYEQPVFLTRYPASQAALARLCPDDPRAAERSELYLGGIELCNAYGELSCAAEQRRRFEAEIQTRAAMGLRTYPLDEPFLRALEEGMPPSSGNALGFDRLVAILLGQADIADTIAFAHEKL